MPRLEHCPFFDDSTAKNVIHERPSCVHAFRDAFLAKNPLAGTFVSITIIKASQECKQFLAHKLAERNFPRRTTAHVRIGLKGDYHLVASRIFPASREGPKSSRISLYALTILPEIFPRWHPHQIVLYSVVEFFGSRRIGGQPKLACVGAAEQGNPGREVLAPNHFHQSFHPNRCPLVMQ